jgi:parvulin-like peptidyl-prolyl isomerase
MYRFVIRSLVLFSVAILSAGTAFAQEVLDGIAAVVNQDVITFSDVRQLVGPKEKAIREQFKGAELVEKIKEVRLQAINDLIDRQLILQEFKNNKYQLPDFVIDERVQTIVREEFGGDRSAFLRTLAAQGYTMEKFKDQQRDVVIVQEMRRMAMKGGTPTVPEEKVLKAYRERAAEFTSEDQIKLRMIAIKHPSANDARLKMIQEIREKIVDGAEFQDLARMYSEDPTQEAGGDWGWINRKQLNDRLTKIAFSLKPGQVSEVIDMAGSYYLLYVEAKKPAVTKPLKEVRGDLEKFLQQQERQKIQQEWLAKLRKKAFVKVF